MSDICFEDVKEFMYADSRVPTADHVITPIGYVPLTLGDIVSIEKHNSGDKNFQKFSEDFCFPERDRFSGLNPRERRFIQRAEPLKHKERFPNIPIRKQILIDYDSRRYGRGGTNSLLDKPDYVVNRTFNRLFRKVSKKIS
ncbi:hypothetical protein K9L16_00290 [Candidatus Pacearchaeota archaeon]|nr:hypothetical protein [Candidatus Pacearchaeota archaeon]